MPTDPTIVPVGEWLPDFPSFQNPGATIARNVIPRSPNSYGPIKAFRSLGFPAVDSRPFGFYSFLDSTGNTHLFTGTATKLYHISTGDMAWADVSGAAYTASVDNPWCFVSMGNSIIATNGSDVPQSFIIGAPTFVDLDASAPFARYAIVARNFLILGDTNEGSNFRQRVHWSAIGDPSTFPTLATATAAQLQSDAQDLRSDLGFVRGLASNLNSADFAVFMDRGVYASHYVGNPVVFDFQIAQGVSGCQIPNSIVVSKGFAYYRSQDGFFAFDGVQVNPIGANKVDNFFLFDPVDGCSPEFIGRTQGSADPTGHYIFWLYCGPQSTGVYNRVLIFNTVLQRWSVARIDATWLGRGLAFGYSLDQLDAFGTMDTLQFSLDSSVWQGGAPVLMGFNELFQLSAFGGDNLAATIETLEAQPSPGRRTRLTSARPIVDGGSPTIAVGSRNRIEDATVYAPAVAMNAYGECPQRIDARYMRGQIDIPAASVWTHCQGVEIDFTRSTPR